MRFVATLLTLVAIGLAGFAAPAVAGKKDNGSGNGKANGKATAGTTCAAPSGSYDSGGAPGVASPVNDPLFARQWGLDQVNAPQAWARGARGAGATIAVLDTGVDLNHPDLSANLLAGADLVSDRGCAGPQDEHGHGTHVAGIAAAVTNNGTGVAGTAPDARVIPVRVLDANGEGDLETIVAGIRYAADRGADVINLSLGELPVVGQTRALNEDLEEAVGYAWGKGSIVVAAAGNESFPLCSYPSFAERAVCVGATDRRGLPSYYSNFPNKPDRTIGVRAPGGVGSVFCEDDEDVWSTMLPSSDYECDGIGGYDTLAGTSMAAPHVAGVAALLAGQGLANQQILERLRDRASNRGAYDPVNGYGIVDADAATAP
jgi:serine protease